MSSSRYHPLPSSSSPTPDEDESTPSKTNPSHQFQAWAHVAVLLTTALSFGLLIFFFVELRFEPETRLPARIPATYINLDKAKLNLTQSFDPIFSYAWVVMQIDAADASRAMREDDRSYRSERGVIYPDDRHIVISSKTSTVIQFRHLDYGMERCVLHAVVPDPANPMHHKPTTQIRQPSTVNVWLLDLETEISRYIAGSWERAPHRKKLLTSFTFHQIGDTVQSEEFLCRTGAYSTFELACDDCAVDFWQVQGQPNHGFFVSQSDSLFA